MNPDEFWQLVDSVHGHSDGDMDVKCELLEEELSEVSDADLRDFLTHFEVADAHAYAWKLWAAAYIINGGCSDDGFSDFRAALISCGRKIYESALKDPDLLAELPDADEHLCYEGYQYIAQQLAKKRFGAHLERTTSFPERPSGESWEEEDLPELLPRLSAIYG